MSRHLAVLIGLVLVGAIHYQDTTSGMAMACLYMLLPYTAFHISQVHHVWPAAFLVLRLVMSSALERNCESACTTTW